MACRLNDSRTPNIMVMALGEPDTPLRQAVFMPESDRMVCDSGEVIADYFKQRLGVAYYRPLDRSVFAQAPAGWCSWYYYGRAITPEEMLVNARWFAANMQEYGLTLMLLDDGWQGGGRDWTGLRATFSRGMKWLAAEISTLGLLPGIWLCPQGQDNEEVVRNAGCFLLNPDGTSVTGFFGGPYTVDRPIRVRQRMCGNSLKS